MQYIMALDLSKSWYALPELAMIIFPNLAIF